MEKVADLLQSEIAELLQRRVRHPVIEDAMVSITHVEVAPDLTSARIHVSVMADAEEQAEVMEALARSSSFLHRELVKRIRIRRVPRLRFELDESIAEADRLTTLMRDVARAEGRESNTGP
jgi:ribosome-binding factor A